MSHVIIDEDVKKAVIIDGGSAMSDEELEELKRKYKAMLVALEREKEAAAQAKETFVEKAVELDDVAKESTLNASTQSILQAIEDKTIEIAEISNSDINNLFD